MNRIQPLYGEERLVQVLQAEEYPVPETLMRAVSEDVQAFAEGAEHSDDITLLAITFCRRPAAEQVKTLRMTMKNERAEMAGVLDAFDRFVAEHHLPFASAQKVKVALEELLSNILLYGFPEGGEHEIDVSVERVDQRLTVTIVDDGIPFDPFQRATLDETASLEDREAGGFGILLVRKLMDGVSYQRMVDRNIVTLNKNLAT